MNQNFVNTFDKFKQEEDKFESLYIFVIRNMTVEAITNEIKRMITIADEMGNNVKKNYIKARLYSFVTFLEGIGLETILSGIYMVYKKIEEIPIFPEWNETLDMFKCRNFVCEYGDKFKLDWLYDYLTDKSYLNVLQLQNNNIKHIFLNQTKRVVYSEKEEKKCDLNEFVNQHIPKGEYCVIHGVSSFIKQLKESTTLKVLNGNKRDEEILEEFDKMLNEKKSIELQKWLDTMSNPDSKDARKLAFGKEIIEAINDNMLKTLFCTPRMKKQVLEKIQTENLVFEIIEIKSYDSSDMGMKLRKDFNGAIGIKFY
jgi:hypothetical protein